MLCVHCYYARMSRPYVLKPATPDHAEGIGRVIRDAIETVNAKDYPPAEIERLVKNFTTMKVSRMLSERRTLVALAGSDIVGTGALQGSEVKSVFVSPALQRSGIGTLLVTEIEAMALREGLDTLDVSSSLSAARFYSALGYIEVTRRFFGAEETVWMTKKMKRPLSG